MNILLTNDDGYLSPGITLLARALRGAGHRAFMVAPDQNRSGASHSFTIKDAFNIKQLDEDTWICGGTPVDCVLLVMAGAIPFTPDLVVSGINAGVNLGTDLLFSATAAAARQAALSGCPAIAFSLAEPRTPDEDFYWTKAAAWAAAHTGALSALWEENTFINVNMPNTGEIPAAFELGFPASRRFHDTVEQTPQEDGATACRFIFGRTETRHERGSDHEILCRGLVSVSRALVQPLSKESPM